MDLSFLFFFPLAGEASVGAFLLNPVANCLIAFFFAGDHLFAVQIDFPRNELRQLTGSFSVLRPLLFGVYRV